MKGTKWGKMYDQSIIDIFQLGVRSIRYSCIKECYWEAPDQGFILFCCDSSSFGNPGAAGFGIIVRDSKCEVVGAMSVGVGSATNYIAEILAVICALEWDFFLNAFKIIIRSDSKTVIHDFCNDNIPWMFRTRWINAKNRLGCIVFQHSYRETNFSADDLAKKGTSIQAGERVIYS
ncbi:uncharacterized protein LOC113352331 [Papaver somniferum]|uniref:uncharacterized protein LOC113352331 n=1 Tax=Papaver somniferum TaxID=3469 RepID=UPI000E6FDD33|nr:uncharacterized protein LOC113352331 [Papaver somniferum]